MIFPELIPFFQQKGGEKKNNIQTYKIINSNKKKSNRKKSNKNKNIIIKKFTKNIKTGN